MRLDYDKNVWTREEPKPVNTLQLFITNKCNLRCEACFYKEQLNQKEMSLEQYKSVIEQYTDVVQKIVLLGGEPTLHAGLEEMLRINQEHSLNTTIYTNGFGVKRLEGANLDNVSVRIGVHGATMSTKPLNRIERVNFPVTIVYMLDKHNAGELMLAAKMSEELGCKRFYISSIRDILKTKNYWKDTKETLSMKEYACTVQDFVKNYAGALEELHIASRGVFETNSTVKACRFANIFPDEKKITCPFDISLKKYTDNIEYNTHDCDKSRNCLLTKVVLKKKH